MDVLSYLNLTYNENDNYQVRNKVICKDGFEISIQGGTEFHYCKPRCKINIYLNLELGFPSCEDELILQYKEDDIYPFVPLNIVEKLISKHGGIIGYFGNGVQKYYENNDL